jgi:hypothetical protein
MGGTPNIPKMVINFGLSIIILNIWNPKGF